MTETNPYFLGYQNVQLSSQHYNPTTGSDLGQKNSYFSNYNSAEVLHANAIHHHQQQQQQQQQIIQHESYGTSGQSPALAHAISLTSGRSSRPRSEKKTVPDDMKDNKYFERRKRNNSAAKKSREARKSREDEIAIRASILEKDNAILRAQVVTLREEANSLKQLLLQKRDHI